LQNCDGRFQIEAVDQACREYGRHHIIVVTMRPLSDFVGEFEAPWRLIIENSQ
jgi:hypothetical protein